MGILLQMIFASQVVEGGNKMTGRNNENITLGIVVKNNSVDIRNIDGKRNTIKDVVRADGQTVTKWPSSLILPT